MLQTISLLLTAAFTPASEQLSAIDRLVEAAIQRGDCPGAVVVVLRGDEVLYRKAFGRRAVEPASEPMTIDTIFDLASLTKPIATGTAIHKLIEQGKLKPSDFVVQYWPEFGTNGKDKITIKHCLLHTSGLTADNSIKDYANGRADSLKNIASLKLEAEPGTRFKYSDVGFIVLGELVERLSGEDLATYTKRHVFQPLKMTDTSFKPAGPERVAPTGKRDGKLIRGEVHDPRAFAMGGVAGHAGLFGTADDIARYARMLLRGGELDGVRILSEHSVDRFCKPRDVPKGQRSLGWDVATGFSAQRGDLFPPGEGFGHTGFTGTSLWIDPPSKTAIIILTNRVHPNEKGNVTRLRREIGTLVAQSTPGINARRKTPEPVRTGVDLLVRDGCSALQGRKIGLVTNHTGRTSDGVSTIDILAKAADVKLVALFSPEHGLRGEKDEKVGDSRDEKTGLPVYSLYGEHRKPTKAMLEGIDTLVYDIQDIGCRFYTYSSTLGLVMEAAKEHGLSVIVLDRPNPLGGVIIEGPIRDPGSNFVAYHTLPLRHGLTVGELARLYNAERKIDVGLTVIPCENWRRGDTFDRTGLPWRNPSPNMRHLTAAMLYPGVGLLEFTNISVGRGTERPFEWIGAPWIDGRALAQALNAKAIPGVRFLPVVRTPSSSVHKGQECGGVDIIVSDWSNLRALSVGLALATTLWELYRDEWETKRLNTLLLHQTSFEAIIQGKPWAEIQSAWDAGIQAFRERRKPFLLYPE